MKFSYQGVDLNTSELLSGDIEAVSEADALRQLGEQQIEVVSLEEFKQKRAEAEKYLKGEIKYLEVEAKFEKLQADIMSS